VYLTEQKSNADSLNSNMPMQVDQYLWIILSILKNYFSVRIYHFPNIFQN